MSENRVNPYETNSRENEARDCEPSIPAEDPSVGLPASELSVYGADLLSADSNSSSSEEESTASFPPNKRRKIVKTSSNDDPRFDELISQVSSRGPPQRGDFAGELEFQVEINTQDLNNNKVLYSDLLNRLYVDMKVDFSVVFHWKSVSAPSPAYVRACVVYSDESQCAERVERCLQHTYEASNQDMRQEIVRNVLHSSREIGSHGVYYCGRPELADSWYSVVVEVDYSGGSHTFHFVCRNSCSNGINRRAIDIIFTFEDASGKVYGRQTIGARVSTKPRQNFMRDLSKKTIHSDNILNENIGRPKTGTTIGRPGKRKMIKTQTVGVDENIAPRPPMQTGSRAMAGTSAAAAWLGEVMMCGTEPDDEMHMNDPTDNDRYTEGIAAVRA